MSLPDRDANQANATIREVMGLVEQARRDVLAELRQLEVKIDARLETHSIHHATEGKAHAVAHDRESDRRAGLIRWAVTTLMTGAGVLFTIVWTLSH